MEKVNQIKEPLGSSTLLFDNRIASKWLNTKDAAVVLGLTENALRIMVHRNQVSSYKFGRRLRFKMDELETLFKKKEGSHGY